MERKLSKNTQVVLVTYNPSLQLLEKNLKALCAQFSKILIVDNGSKNSEDIKLLAKKTASSIDTEQLDDNYGIAYAQNIGLKLAIKKNLKWLLTIDQDSVIPDNLSAEYEKILNKYDDIGLVAWNQMPFKLGKGDESEKNFYIISSGCLNNVDALKKCGGFDDKLFIDHVDTDINIKIINLGYRTVTTNKVKLSHEIGKATSKKTLRGLVFHKHSPLRVYYIVRNGVVLFKRYICTQPAWIMKVLFISFRESIYLIGYSPNKIRNFEILLKAWIHGIFNRLGKY